MSPCDEQTERGTELPAGHQGLRTPGDCRSATARARDLGQGRAEPSRRLPLGRSPHVQWDRGRKGGGRTPPSAQTPALWSDVAGSSDTRRPPRAPCASNRFCRGPARVVTTPRPAQPAWPRSAGATGGSTAGPVTGSQRDDAGAAPAASSETPRREAAGLGDGNRGSDSDRAAQASRRRGAARRDAETSPQHRRNGCASSARNAPERRSQTARAPRRV